MNRAFRCSIAAWILLSATSFAQFPGSGILPGPAGLAKLDPDLWASAEHQVWTDAAIQFNAADKSHLEMDTPYNPETKDIGISVHIYLDTSTATQTILCTGGTIDGQDGLCLQVNSDGNVVLGFNDSVQGSRLTATFTAGLSDTTWHHLFLYCDRSGNATLYVDGVANGVTLDISTHNASLGAIGGNVGSDLTPANYFNGRLDSMMIFEAADLSAVAADIIDWAYNSGVGRIGDDITDAQKIEWGAISCWDFNGPVGGGWVDSWGSNHLTPMFAEMISNGTFTGNADGWSLGADWAYDANNITATASDADASQTVTPTVGKLYSTSYTVSGYAAGSLRLTLGGVDGDTKSADGTFAQTMRATATDVFVIESVTTLTATVDDVSVQAAEILPAPGIARGLASDSNFAVSLNGSSQYFSETTDVFDPGTGDFSVGSAFYPESLDDTMYLFSLGTSGGQFASLSVETGIEGYPRVYTTPTLGTPTYYVRADGSAANKAAATSPLAAATAMSVTVFNAETFSSGDIVVFSSRGGDFTDATVTIPSGGEAGNPIIYAGESGHEPTFTAAGGSMIESAQSHIEIRSMTVDGADTRTSCLDLTAGTGIVTRDMTLIDSANQCVQHSGTVSVTHYNLECSGAADEGLSCHDTPTVVVRGGSIHDCDVGANFIDGPTLSFYGTHFYGNTAQCIKPNNASGEGTFVFEDCLIDYTGYASNATDISYGDWTFTRCVWLCNSAAYCLLFRAGVTNGTVNRCTFYGGAVTTAVIFNLSDKSDIQNTLFLSTGTGRPFYYDVSGNKVLTNNAAYDTGALFYGSNNVTADPALVDAAGGDYRPSASSPLLGAGVSGVTIGAGNQLGCLRIRIGDGSGAYVESVSSNIVKPGNWYTFVLSADRDENAVLYVNNSAWITSSMSMITANMNCGSLSLGTLGGSDLFDGLLDNMLVVTEALSSDEVVWLHNDGEWRQWAECGVAGTDGENLTASVVKGFWEFDDADDLGADSTTNSNDLTSVATPTQAQGIAYTAGIASYWLPRIGTAITCESPLAARPAWLSTGITRASVSGDGVDDLLESPTQTLTGGFTIACAVQAGTTASDYPICGSDDGNNYVNLTDNTTITVAIADGSSQAYTVSAIGTDAHVIMVVRDGSNSLQVFVDGSESSTGAQTLAGTMTLNRLLTDGTNYADIDIGDIGIVNSAITAAKRSFAERYLASRYSISLSP